MLLAMGLSIGGGTSFADVAVGENEVGESEDDVRIAVDLLDDLSVAATMRSVAATETLGH